MTIKPNCRKPDTFSLEIMQRDQNIQCCIAYLLDLYKDDVDINDAAVQNKVLRNYNLSDATAAELEYISTQLTCAIAFGA